ncbi:hypothetical protein ACP70R_023745 [Stipagrostis hirtigluma subsp. patula]
MRPEMADTNLELVPVTNEEEMRRKRRKKRKRVGAVLVVAMMTMISDWYYRKRPRHIVDAHEVAERNVIARKQMLRNLYQGSNVYCYDSLRLTKRSFSDLCAILRERAGLHDTLNVSVEEKVAMFLLIVGHGTKMRVIQSTYGWSLEPISRHFNEVLRGILSLRHEFIKLPDPSAVQPNDPKWKWFEDCLGALDGTHIDVFVPLADQGRYRNRKQRITTNVLGVCDRHMKFVYVLAGWEGSASDSRVLRDAMTREDAFAVPNGKYYLVDAGYTNGPGFLAPYRSTRYHLNEWAAQGNNPSTARELYNLRHASARNVIERTFGLLKMRWAILRTHSFFDLKNQQRDMDDLLLHEVDNMISVESVEVQEQASMITNVQSSNEWNNFRDTKANQMFADYQARRGQHV